MAEKKEEKKMIVGERVDKGHIELDEIRVFKSLGLFN